MFSGAAMKRLATAIATIALVGTSAFAADMAVKAPPPAPAPVYSWTGWYGGGNVGYGWGQNQSVDFSDVPGPLVSASVGIPAAVSFNASGALGGFQLGTIGNSTKHGWPGSKLISTSRTSMATGIK
jgi:outer membrane immunogenic protein